MKYTSKILLLAALIPAAMFTSCRVHEIIDPSIEINGLGGTEYTPTELDNWLTATFLDPYNIEVVYRWDADYVYSGVTKRLVPPKAEKVKPMMSVIAEIWFEPYRIMAPYGFLQRTTPKTIVLAGSPEYTSSSGNSMVLGTAEGAVQIYLTNVNAFNASNRASLVEYMHSIEHEFTHVLNQQQAYTPDFNDLTNAAYDPSNWDEYSQDEAFALGFFSNYSMASPDEDFAEVLSLLLTNGYDWALKVIADLRAVNNNTAADALRSKVDIVAAYMQDAYGIQLLDDGTGKGLITCVQEAIDYVVNNAEQFTN
jgi:substrate import-associated zinc metallohydrolase lipoprotein